MSPTALKRIALGLAAVLLLWLGSEVLAGRGGAAERFRLIPELDTARVDTVEVRKTADTIRLTRSPTGAWSVNGHPASAQEVSDLLSALGDSLEGELVARNPASHGRMQVDSASGTRLLVVAGGRTAAQLIVGKRGNAWQSRYVRPEGDDRVYLLESRLASLVDHTLTDWRDKRIVAVNPDGIARLTVERGRERYTLVRRDTAWAFETGEPADSTRARRLVDEFRNLQAQGGPVFASPAQADSADFRRPDRRLVLVSPQGDTLAHLLFDSTATGFWVRHDSGGFVYHLPSWKTDDLAPEREELKKASPPSAAFPSSAGPA